MEGMKYMISILMIILSFACFEMGISCDCKPRKYRSIPLGPNQMGPEALDFDCRGGGPYVGLADGRILKWHWHNIGWKEFAVTSPNSNLRYYSRPSWCNGVRDSPGELQCGRPLGIKFNLATCELYIADSTYGLMRVGPYGGLATVLATSAGGFPFRFLNGLDVDSVNGAIYFTESSMRYRHWESGEAISDGDQSGRLMKYDLRTKTTTVLLSNLSFPNGVAVSKRNDFVLVSETTTSRVLKYWLTTPKAGTSELFMQLSGGPDNINRNSGGDFWIAQQRDTNFNSIKVDEFGRVLDRLESNKITHPTHIHEFGKLLWIGFVDQPYINYTLI